MAWLRMELLWMIYRAINGDIAAETKAAITTIFKSHVLDRNYQNTKMIVYVRILSWKTVISLTVKISL